MPNVYNPNAVANSQPGQLKKVARDLKDLAGSSHSTIYSLVVGAGGAIFNGVAQFLGGITGPMGVTGSISATTSVTAGTSVNSATLATSSDATVGGLIRNVAAYSNPITTSYRAVWVTSIDGQFGYNLSSREFKQDIETLIVDPKVIVQLRAVSFRYIAAVESGVDETQVGLIAEEVHDLGLEWLVEYDDGKPCGIKLHLIALAVLIVTQQHDDRIAALEQAMRHE